MKNVAAMMLVTVTVAAMMLVTVTVAAILLVTETLSCDRFDRVFVVEQVSP